jgi:hypothetical protein
MARLLDSLDDLARPAVSDGPSGPTGGTDVSTVVSNIAGRLRLDDGSTMSPQGLIGCRSIS